MIESGSPLSSISMLGSGLGYRRELKNEIFANAEGIDFLEVLTEHFLGNGAGDLELAEICDRFVAVPHGIGLSIGSDRLDLHYLSAIKRISDKTRAPYYSEHLSVTRAAGVEIGHLSPLWFTEAVLAKTIENVRTVQETLEKPLVLENITYPFEIPNASMSQAEFFTRLIEGTGCGILLDVTNLDINAMNHRLDPLAFLRGLPLDHIVQVHLAGGFTHGGVAIDSHSRPVEESSWKLFEALARLATIKGSIVEHDANYPEFAVLLDQVSRARSILSSSVVLEKVD